MVDAAMKKGGKGRPERMIETEAAKRDWERLAEKRREMGVWEKTKKMWRVREKTKETRRET
jgi:uncharacterized cupin superfamily protein